MLILENTLLVGLVGSILFFNLSKFLVSNKQGILINEILESSRKKYDKMRYAAQFVYSSKNYKITWNYGYSKSENPDIRPYCIQLKEPNDNDIEKVSSLGWAD